MKAVFMNNHGGPEVLQYGEVPDPVANAGEVLVDIHAASINGADWKVRAGIGSRPSQFPHILGRDFSGVVISTGAGIDDLEVGDAVFGVCDIGQEGAYAEKIAVKSAIVARKPDSLSHVNAAAVALTGLTALRAIEDTLMLQRDETILIQGGAGGVGSLAIQVAKHIGARVITTATSINHDYLKRIGADRIIDYNVVDFEKVVSGCDAVLDTVGGEVARKSFEVLRPGGRAAFIASGAKIPTPERDDVTSLKPHVGRDRSHLERIVELHRAGAITPPDVTLYHLTDAIAAHRLSESRHFKGKLVFQIR